MYEVSLGIFSNCGHHEGRAGNRGDFHICLCIRTVEVANEVILYGVHISVTLVLYLLTAGVLL